MRQILFLSFVLALFTACSSDDDLQRNQPGRRTVLVYMSAENDLTGFDQSDIDEIITGRQQVGDDDNLLLYVDRASATQRPFIALVTKDQRQPLDTLYQFPTDFYSSDPARFREVLKWVVSNCPAREDYGLVLWGHANGWTIMQNGTSANAHVQRRAYGRDTGDNTSGNGGLWLDIPDMRQALEQVGIRWKFIFCDCCNMQSVEVAYELRHVCDYLIASPAEITGIGAPYDTMVKDFFLRDDVQMYTSICDDYYAQATNEYGEKSGTLNCQLPISTIRMDRMQALADSTRRVLPAVASALEMPCRAFSQPYLFYFRVIFRDGWEIVYKDDERVCYDMKDVFTQALCMEPDALRRWLAAYDAAVVYARKSGKWHSLSVRDGEFAYDADRQGCVSMFFPLGMYENARYRYNETIGQMQWYQAVGWSAFGW